MPVTANKASSSPKGPPSAGGRRMEVIEPPTKLLDKITYVESREGRQDMIERADRTLALMSVEFGSWLDQEREFFVASWADLRAHPSDGQKFQLFHAAVHRVLGNAAILGSKPASDLARPLAFLVERSPDIGEFVRIIDIAVEAIASVLKEKCRSR